MTSPINAFGFTVIPVSEYQDLVSGNQTKSDRITELTEQRNSALKGNDHLECVIESLKLDALLLERQSKAEKDALTEQLRMIDDASRTTITDLQKQVEKLEESDRIATETIDDLDSLVVSLRKEIASLQQDLKSVKENYSKVLAANADLDSKLSEAIANLSATELQCNEQTVQIATLKTSRNALLQDFDSSKRAVNIELDNHRIAILKVVDELERSLRNPSVEVV